MDLSPSKIITFLQCPKRFYFDYIEGLEREPSIHELLGTAVHYALYTFYDEIDFDIAMKTSDLPGYFFAVSIKALNEYFDEVRRHSDFSKDLELFAFQLMKNFSYREAHRLSRLKEDYNGQLGRIKRLFFPVLREETIEYDGIKGIVDRVELNLEKELVVTDYKTSKRYPGGMSRFHTIQVSIYAYMLKNKSALDIKWAGCYYLRTGEAYYIRITPEELRRVRDLISRVRSQISRFLEDGKFPRKRSILCKWCPFSNVCRR